MCGSMIVTIFLPFLARPSIIPLLSGNFLLSQVKYLREDGEKSRKDHYLSIIWTTVENFLVYIFLEFGSKFELNY